MAVKKQAPKATGGRQASYTARNRAKLLQSALQVLAEIGPSATIDQLTSVAQVSPTTIYKYFENKDALFLEALDGSWREWVAWSYNGEPAAQSLEQVMSSTRKLFWLEKTHPQLAKILQKTLTNPIFLVTAVREGATESFRKLAELGEIKSQDFDKRIILQGNCLVGLLTAVHVTGQLSPTEAEFALGISLSIWGVSEARAAKILARPLVFNPVN